MNIPFLEAPREVTFDWHIAQATKWVEFDAGRELDSVLVRCEEHRVRSCILLFAARCVICAKSWLVLSE